MGLRSRWRSLRYPVSADPSQHWLRQELDRSVGRHIEQLGPQRLTAVEVSGDAHARHRWLEYTSLEHPAFDVCAPAGDEGTFDVVICEQVLEHVVDPFAAARTLRALAKPGGYVIVSTPFLVMVHELPLYGMFDYWRFTPRGLRRLLEQAGLEVDEVHSWGNREAVRANLDGWIGVRDRHRMDDEEHVPLQVWAFARNPG